MKFIEKYQKIFALCGMIGPFFYAMIWILGGILQPGYNHITDDVSTLLAVGAPNKLLFDLMEATYGILMIIFFASLHWTINKGKGSILGPGAFLVNFVLHVVAVFFPLDAGGYNSERKNASSPCCYIGALDNCRDGCTLVSIRICRRLEHFRNLFTHFSNRLIYSNNYICNFH